MTRNDMIILVVSCAILVVGGFVVLNKTVDQRIATEGIDSRSLALDESSFLLNPNDLTAPLVDTNRGTSTEVTSQGTSTVYLTQVPYTGMSSNIKVFLFVLGMSAWTGGLAYFLVRRKALMLK